MKNLKSLIYLFLISTSLPSFIQAQRGYYEDFEDDNYADTRDQRFEQSQNPRNEKTINVYDRTSRNKQPQLHVGALGDGLPSAICILADLIPTLVGLYVVYIIFTKCYAIPYLASIMNRIPNYLLYSLEHTKSMDALKEYLLHPGKKDVRFAGTKYLEWYHILISLGAMTIVPLLTMFIVKYGFKLIGIRGFRKEYENRKLIMKIKEQAMLNRINRYER